MKLVIPMPASEIWDRATICYLKRNHMPDSPEVESWTQFCRMLYQAAPLDTERKMELYNALRSVNGEIWDAEDAIRTGAVDGKWEDDPERTLSLARAAMKVRDLNRKRCAIKQEINKIFGDCWGEAKHNYGPV